MHDTISVYYRAAHYAVNILCDAPRYFDRIHQLSQSNTLDELKSIIDGWKRVSDRPKAKPIPAGRWAIGSVWGDSLRVAHDRGIIWELRCACGEYFERSTNDSIPDEKRKCPSCQLADRLSEANQAVISRLESTAQLVLAWHRQHDKVIWMKVHDACRRRNITDDNFKQELHALVWAKISEKAVTYRDTGFKVSAWLGTVAHHALLDFFTKEWHRAELAPMLPLPENSGNRGIPNSNPSTVDERVPARKVAPKGASPNTKALNPTQTAWDVAQLGWNTAERPQDGTGAGTG